MLTSPFNHSNTNILIYYGINASNQEKGTKCNALCEKQLGITYPQMEESELGWYHLLSCGVNNRVGLNATNES